MTASDYETARSAFEQGDLRHAAHHLARSLAEDLPESSFESGNAILNRINVDPHDPDCGLIIPLSALLYAHPAVSGEHRRQLLAVLREAEVES